jgi:hypothetical protein
MFYTLQAYVWSMTMTTAIPSEGGGGGALEEEAVVDASCPVALASRAVAEVCSSSRRRAMARTRAWALAARRVAILSVMRCCKAAAALGGYLVGDALL